MANIVWLSVKEDVPARGYWDTTLLQDIFDGLGYSERTIVVIPGAYQNDAVDEINKELAKYPKVLVVVTSDEENKFDPRKLKHQDLILYVNYPNIEIHKDADYFLPIGYTPDTRPMLKQVGLRYNRTNWFFSGQLTHQSRHELAEQLKNSPIEGTMIGTEGFAQGLEHKDYFKMMATTKVVPAPGGPCSPDSFRMYEALEAGAIPIPENPKFFKLLYSDTPFQILNNWENVNDYIDNFKDRYPSLNNEVSAWWQWQKRAIKYRFEKDLEINPTEVTVLVPTSPIPSHPDPNITFETIESIRKQLPNAEIIVMIDGVRKEQKNRLKSYNRYVQKLLWKMNHEWQNVYPLYFKDHSHQAKMTTEALKHVKTPYVLFAEHDTPLCGFIEWGNLYVTLENGTANVIRFHFENVIPDAHKHLMLSGPQVHSGVSLIPTAQWSQRPHLARTDFYRKMMAENFSEKSITMIEDKVHGVLYDAYKVKGKVGWSDWKVWIYAPEGDMAHSLNLDGRKNDPKYEMVF
jgi:hypothetical protein